MRTVGRFVGADVNAVPLIPMGLYIHPGTKGTISGWGVVVWRVLSDGSDCCNCHAHWI